MEIKFCVTKKTRNKGNKLRKFKKNNETNHNRRKGKKVMTAEL